jgi:hypothetical protein
MARPHRFAVHLALGTASLLAFAVVVEAVLRLGTLWSARRQARDLGAPGARPALPPRGRARLGDIVRRSGNPRLVYELRPGLDVRFTGQPLRTNTLGFRGPEIETSKPPGTLRLLGLGDSVMFGWGVREEEGFLWRLEEKLRELETGAKWEVVNLAVPGYNTVMELELLRERGLALEPDLIVLNFVGNDLSLPYFIVAGEDWLDPRRSFLLDLVRGRLHLLAAPARSGLARAPPRAPGDPFAEVSGGVPARYRDMVGEQAWRRAMGDLAVLASRRGVPVIVLAHPEAPPFVHAACRELDLDLVETRTALEAYMGARGITEMRGSELTITAADPHPSAGAHEIIASVLVGHLRESGLLARLASR